MMMRNSLSIVAIASLALTACGESGPGGDGEGGEAGIDSLPAATTGGETTGETAPEDDDETSPSTNPTNPTEDTMDTMDTMDSNGSGPGFDVGDGNYCQALAEGFYCTDEARTAVECDANNSEIGRTSCVPGTCLEPLGCVVCLEGNFDCQGDRIMECDTSGGAPHAWVEIGVCDPTLLERCNAATGMCEPSSPVGTEVPTGVYFEFANFNRSDEGSAYLGGYDVDGLGDKLYTVRTGSTAIDVYSIELLDSDGDGQFEPNQHPLNVDDPGEIEERVLTFLETIPPPTTLDDSKTELYAVDDRLYIGGAGITEYVFATMTPTLQVNQPAFIPRLSMIAYDEVNQAWYGAHENARRVLQYNANTMSWGIMFDYPELAGSHMDGLEVVPDAVTGVPYVYVSDMTSDFIGQYRKDPEVGWVQENLFSYEGEAGEPVEGMGFGPLNHFWATSGNSIYELGGGDLTIFTEPPG